MTGKLRSLKEDEGEEAVGAGTDEEEEKDEETTPTKSSKTVPSGPWTRGMSRKAALPAQGDPNPGIALLETIREKRKSALAALKSYPDLLKEEERKRRENFASGEIQLQLLESSDFELEVRKSVVQNLGYVEWAETGTEVVGSSTPSIIDSTSSPSRPNEATTTVPNDSSGHSSNTNVGTSGSEHPTTPAKPQYQPVYDKKKRAEDAAFCKAHLFGRVLMEDRVERLFGAMGGDTMVQRYKASHAAVATRGVTRDEKQRIEVEFTKESKIRNQINKLLSKAAENRDEDSLIVEKIPEDGKMESKEAGASSAGGSDTEFNEPGAKWLTEMSEMAKLGAADPTFHVFSAPNTYLPIGTFVHSRRMPDALLTLDESSYAWRDTHLLMEFSLTTGRRPISRSVGSEKMHQLLTNLVNLVSEQPTRNFAAAFAIMKDTFTFALLDCQNLRIFEEHDCFGTGFENVCAIISTLLHSNKYELGLSPLFVYRGSLPTFYDPRSLLPNATSRSNPELVIPLASEPLSLANVRPFTRGTAVYGGLIEPLGPTGGTTSDFLAVKQQFCHRVGREAASLQVINTKFRSGFNNLTQGLIKPCPTSRAADPDFQRTLFEEMREASATLFPVIKSKHSFRSLRCQTPADELTTGTARHIEVLVLSTTSKGTPISKSTEIKGGEDLGKIFSQIVFGIEILREEDIVHQDLSTNNILVLKDGSACIIDFDCSRCYAGTPEPIGPKRTGTRDCMSISLLQGVVGGFHHHPTHDLESVSYILWKVLTTLIDDFYSAQPALAKQNAQWPEFFSALHWNDNAKDSDVQAARIAMWTRNLERLKEMLEDLAEDTSRSGAGLLKMLSAIGSLPALGLTDVTLGYETILKKGQLKLTKEERRTLIDGKLNEVNEKFYKITEAMKEIFQAQDLKDDPLLGFICSTVNKYRKEAQEKKAKMEAAL